MAQTKRKRQSKHRGNAAGKIEVHGGNAKRPEPARGKSGSRSALTPEARRIERMTREPTWRSAVNKAGIASLLFAVIALVILKYPIATALAFGVITFAIYVPLSFYTDRFVYQRNVRKLATEKKAGKR